MDDSNLSSMLKPTLASTAPRTDDTQARILADSGASSKRTRADEGPGNNPKRRMRQENSSIPWNRHPPVSTGVHHTKRVDEAGTTTREFDATPDHAPQVQHLVQEVHLSPPAKSKIIVPIWIITPGVRSAEELWADGKMLGSTLVAFVEGISKVKQLGHIEKIKLTLTTTVMSVIRDTNITVFQGDEDLWDFAKDAFRDKMKQEMTEAQANKVKARFRILVEPFYEQEEFEF